MVKTIDRQAIQQSMIADTYGWDTVYAIKYEDVNKSIAKSGVSQTLPQLVETSGSTTITVNQGDFGDWALAMGGDGQNVRMDLPISEMTFDDGTVATFDGLVATIEVCLSFIPQRDTALYGAEDDAEWMELKISTTARGDNSSGAAVSIIDLTCSGSTCPDGVQAETIKSLLGIWLNKEGNLREFNHVFAAVNLNDKAGVSTLDDGATNDFRWLKPSHLGYAVADGATLADSVFAVLAVTERDEGEPAPDPEMLFHRVSANAIPAGQRSAFLLSKERFLQKMLLPGAGMFFTGPITAEADKTWPQDYFELEDSGSSIRNTTDIYIENFQIGSETARAEVKTGNFAVHLRDDCLELEVIDMHHPYSKFLFWVDTFHTIRTQMTPAILDQDTPVEEGGPYDKTQFVLSPSEAANAVHDHQVIAVKSKATQWIQIGLLSASILCVFAGAYKGIQLYRAGQRVASLAGETAALAQTAQGAGGGAVAVTQITPAAAGEALAAVGGTLNGQTMLGSIFALYKTTIFSSIVTGFGVTTGLISLLEAIANADAPNVLPDFKDVMANVMSPVRWPTEESEFTPKEVAFNGSFQIAGVPDFADD